MSSQRYPLEFKGEAVRLEKTDQLWNVIRKFACGEFP